MLVFPAPTLCNILGTPRKKVIIYYFLKHFDPYSPSSVTLMNLVIEKFKVHIQLLPFVNELNEQLTQMVLLRFMKPLDLISEKYYLWPTLYP